MKKKRRRPIYVPSPNLAASMLKDSGPEQAPRFNSEYEETVLHERMKQLEVLFQQYGLPMTDLLAWPVFTYRFLCDHHPAFRVSHKKPGRPRKPRAKRPVGRPSTRTGIHWGLLQSINNYKQRARERGRNHISDKEAIEYMVREQARKRHERANQQDIQYFQRIASDARKKYPEIPR